MSRLHALAINAEGFAFNPLSGECFRLNATGETVIARLRDGASPETVARELAAAHGVEAGRALADVLEFRSRLVALRLADHA